MDDEGAGDAGEGEGEQGRDGQQNDEGGSVWEDDEECAGEPNPLPPEFEKSAF